MVDTTSSTSRKVAKSKEYKQLHDLHESVVRSTPARLLGSRRNKQTSENGKRAQLSFLNRNSGKHPPAIEASSDYGNDFSDDDFPSPSTFLAQLKPNDASRELPEDEFGLDDMDDVCLNSPKQMEPTRMTSWSENSKPMVNDGHSKQLLNNSKNKFDIQEEARKLEDHKPLLFADDDFEDDEGLTIPDSPRLLRQQKDLSRESNTLLGNKCREDNEKPFLSTSPEKQPEGLPNTCREPPRGSKRQGPDPEYEDRNLKKPKHNLESGGDRAPLTVNASSQNSQPETDRLLRHAKAFGNENRVSPSPAKSLTAPESRQNTDMANLIPKGWGDRTGIDLSLLAEFADYVEFE